MGGINFSEIGPSASCILHELSEEETKDFEKSVRKLSGKTLNSVRNTILEVKNASCLDEITDCKKIAAEKFAFYTYTLDITVAMSYLYMILW